MFKRVLTSADTYGEYGCGASTSWVLVNTEATVFAVDTSEEWVNSVVEANEHSGRLNAQHVDLGPVGEWGRPRSYDRRENFGQYTDWIWEQEAKPQVVLIDGRFRVACFLTTLLRAAPGTAIIFDDYLDRPQYHIVEELLPRIEICGRQCRFMVPPRGGLDTTAAEDLLARFRYVFD